MEKGFSIENSMLSFTYLSVRLMWRYCLWLSSEHFYLQKWQSLHFSLCMFVVSYILLSSPCLLLWDCFGGVGFVCVCVVCFCATLCVLYCMCSLTIWTNDNRVIWCFVRQHGCVEYWLLSRQHWLEKMCWKNCRPVNWLAVNQYYLWEQRWKKHETQAV